MLKFTNYSQAALLVRMLQGFRVVKFSLPLADQNGDIPTEAG